MNDIKDAAEKRPQDPAQETGDQGLPVTERENKEFTVLVATGNPGKVRELSDLMSDPRVRLLTLKDIADVGEVAETGSTFSENAEIKAAGYARQTGLWSVADDSGLEVDALNGAPGVFSARFAGRDSTYETKIAELLRQIDSAGAIDRSARFACSMAISDPRGRIVFSAEGICQGSIARGPRGSGGFGYDPVFVPDGFEQTFGELPEHIKQQISHRARAAREIIRYLLDFIAV